MSIPFADRDFDDFEGEMADIKAELEAECTAITRLSNLAWRMAEFVLELVEDNDELAGVRLKVETGAILLPAAAEEIIAIVHEHFELGVKPP